MCGSSQIDHDARYRETGNSKYLDAICKRMQAKILLHEARDLEAQAERETASMKVWTEHVRDHASSSPGTSKGKAQPTISSSVKKRRSSSLKART